MSGHPLATVSRLVRTVGICAVVLATLPPLLRQLGIISQLGSGLLPSPAAFSLWLVLAAVYAAAFWWTIGRIGRDELGPPTWAALGLQAVSWVVMFWITGGWYQMARTQLVLGAAQLGLIVSIVPGLALVVALGAIQCVVGLRHYSSEGMLSSYVTLLLPYGFAALLATHLMGREVLAREALARSNAELRDMQAALAEKQRLDERLRISRELHDLVGHHLTALSLQLEVAHHMRGDDAREHVTRCQDLTRVLLKDVREVVSSLRAEPVPSEALPAGDLLGTLQGLSDGIVRPQVHLEAEPGLNPVDAEAAHILVRCVQEIITNGVKHSHAENLWIRLSSAGGRVRIHARDDGVGSRFIRRGNGLRGMAERVERAGGSLSVKSRPTQGFRLDLVLPVTGGVS